MVLGGRRAAGRGRIGAPGAPAGGEGILLPPGEDVRDAADLADLLRMGRLPEAYLAPPAVRELREAVRHRAKLVALRSGLKAQVHAVLAKQGLLVPVSDLFGVGGRDRLTRLELPAVYRARVDALCRLIDAYDFEVDAVGSQLRGRLAAHAGYQAIQAVPGVGPVLAAVFVAEIGEVDRFTGPAKLCCWAGLTPRHRESDTTIRRGSITKQGSVLVRWAAIEAVQKLPASAGWLVTNRARIAERRGRNIATVAVARKLLTLVYYGLRDGHIRALARPQAAAGRCRRRTGRTAAAVRPPRRTRRRPHPRTVNRLHRLGDALAALSRPASPSSTTGWPPGRRESGERYAAGEAAKALGDLLARRGRRRPAGAGSPR